MIDCRLYWADSDEETPFDSAELLALPRVGDPVWLQHTNDDREHICDYNVEVVSIQHVAGTDEDDPYIELHVVELDRTDVDPTKVVNYECENCGFEGTSTRAQCCAHEKQKVVM